MLKKSVVVICLVFSVVFVSANFKVSAAEAAYRDTIQAESTLLNYWPLDNNAGATSTALVGSANMFLSSTTASVAGQIDGTAVSFNGTSGFGSSTASIDLSSTNKVVIEGLIFLNAGANADNVAWELSTNINTVTTGFNFSPDLLGTASTSVLVMKGNGGYNYDFYNRPSYGGWHHIVTIFDKGQATVETSLYIDGVLVTATSTGGYSNNTNNFGNLPFYLMSRAGASGFLGGKLQHVAIYSDLSAARILAHAQASGIASTTYTVQASDLWDNAYDNTTDTPRQSNYARFVFTTDAGSITVTGSSSIYASYPTYAHLGLRVNGSDQSPLAFTTNGSQNFSVSLGSPGTTKTVELISGLESKPTVVLGSFINSITYPGTSTFAVATPTAQTSRVLFYGDSITAGGNATNSETTSFVPLLRNTYSHSVMLEAWGYRSLHEDTNTTPLRTALVNRIASSSPAIFWIPIGSNDYGLNKWSAANFGTAYSALLDDLHTALPSMRIVCQTPFARSSEAANSFGNTLGNYRTQVTTACSNRSYAIIVDDSTLAGTSDMDDGVHPTTAGHTKIAVGINNVLTLKPTLGAVSTSSLSTTAVTLNSSISAVGSTTPTDRGFNYGLTSSYGSTASTTGTFSTGSFSESLSGLTCETTYHYRAFVANFAGTASTSDATFLTDTCPVVATTSESIGPSTRGASISRRITNLIASGNTTAAQQLANQYPQVGAGIPRVGAVMTNSFSRNLTSGMTGNDVKTLQMYLNSKGFSVALSGHGSVGNETMTFGAFTRAALARFQKANGISPAVGFFGPITRAFILK
jgi:lysophospholipase L1-like esterase